MPAPRLHALSPGRRAERTCPSSFFVRRTSRRLGGVLLAAALGAFANGCVAPVEEAETDDERLGQAEQPLSFLPNLPYPAGTAMGVSQGWGGSWSHTGNLYYGIDFNLPGTADLGIHVLAVADGTVTYRYDDCTCEGCSCNGGWGNAVVIDHGGGEFSKYTHFQYGSIPDSIQVGTTVCAGMHVGNIGNTGASTGSHLHFQFQSDGTLNGPSIPFDRFAETSGVPQEGGSYASSNQERSDCGPPEPCSITVEGPATVIDEQSDCFTRLGSYWWEEPSGYDDHHYFTYTIDDDQPDSSGTWEAHVGAAGTYDVEAYVPSSPDPLSQAVPYIVRHDGDEATVTVDQSAHRGSWVLLGTYDFAEGGDQWIRIGDNSGEPYVGDDGPRLLVDAVRWTAADGCVDECAAGKRCAGTGYQLCGDFDADGCLEWGDDTACEARTHCEGAGECVADDGAESEADQADAAAGSPDVGLPPDEAAAGLEGVVCAVSAPGTKGRAGASWTLLALLLLSLAQVRARGGRPPRSTTRDERRAAG